MYAQLYNPKTIEKKYSTINITDNQKKAAKEWIKKLKNKELEKEKKNYFVFRDVVLRDLLGYPEEKILYEEKNVEFSIQDEHGDTGVCFEAKGSKTKDLFARQGYEKKEQENPVVQTLSNMERFPASYGVCTNYRNFVLLDIKKRLSKCHRFDFLSIENSDKKLKEFIGIFSYKNLVIEKTLDELYNSSVSEEREFTKEFYKLFHETRLMLIKAFQEKEKVTMDEAIHYAQLYLNRLIFIFFAEDKGDIDERLFSKRVLKILEAGQGTESTRLVSEDVLKLFKYLDKGSDVQGIFGFNGGLFKERIPSKIYFFDLKNPEFFAELKQHSKLSKKITLDELSSKIVKKYKNKLNPIISNLLIMDSFDFNTEVNVNILGHMFEQSISDLEDLREEGISRRRKEGVFYTPEYITEYICTKTIIPYLSKNNAATVTELIGEYLENPEELESRIRKIKILDPACGSGAFLIKAVEILLEIDKEIQSIKPQTNGQSHLEDWSEEKEITKIIEKNVFGVDINEESVEITKLSLFLKMASVNKKLSNLSQNIIIGNSLVDDSSIDNNAFNWKTEFKEIFEEGGFDVVIGNPPYVRVQNLSHEIIDWYKKNKKSAYKRIDLSILFIELAFELVKKNGKICFITSNQFFKAEYGRKIREIIRCYLSHNIDFSDVVVFEGLSNYVSILSFDKLKKSQFTYSKINQLTESFSIPKWTTFDYKDFSDDSWEFTENKAIKDKMYKNSELLGDIADFTYGIITGLDDAFVLSDKMVKKEKIEKDFLIPFVKPDNYKRYKFNSFNKFIIYPYDINDNIIEEKEFSRRTNTFKHLSPFKKRLENRKDSRTSIKEKGLSWFSLIRRMSPSSLEPHKIIFYDVGNHPNFNYDEKGVAFGGGTTHSIKASKPYSNNYLLGILNSSLLKWLIFDICPIKMGKARKYGFDYMKRLPIKKISSTQKLIIEKVDLMLKYNNEFSSTKNKFLNRIKENFNLDKLSTKIQKFYDLDFKEISNELRKAKVTLSLQQQDEWEDYFLSRKKEILNLQEKINRVDKEIDELVFKLYELTNEEKQIIIDSLEN